MDLSSALRAIGRGWYFLVIGLVASIIAAVLLNEAKPPTYDAVATYVVSPRLDDAGDVDERVKTLESTRSRAILTTFIEFLTSDTVHTAAGTTISLDRAALGDYDVTAAIIPESNVIETTVTGPNPQVGVLLAQAVGEDATRRFIDLYQIYDIVQLDPPTAPSTPSSAPLTHTLVTSGALGLLAGGALALVFGSVTGGGHRRRTMGDRIGAYGDDRAVTSIDARYQRYPRAG